MILSAKELTNKINFTKVTELAIPQKPLEYKYLFRNFAMPEVPGLSCIYSFNVNPLHQHTSYGWPSTYTGCAKTAPI